MTRPGRLRYIANGVGRPLPESIGDRIRNDLTGSAATPGHLMRSMLAFLAVYAGVALLLPGSPAFRAAALVLAVVLALGDSFAFIAMNTQRRPAQRYRAEDLGNARSDRRHEREREPRSSRNDGRELSASSTNIPTTDGSGTDIVTTLSHEVRKRRVGGRRFETVPGGQQSRESRCKTGEFSLCPTGGQVVAGSNPVSPILSARSQFSRSGVYKPPLPAL